jgi:hypothetical protein
MRKDITLFGQSHVHVYTFASYVPFLLPAAPSSAGSAHELNAAYVSSGGASAGKGLGYAYE